MIWVGLLKLKYAHQGGHGRNASWRSSNTIRAHTKGSIPHQYLFDTNYFQLLKLYIRQHDLKPIF